MALTHSVAARNAASDAVVDLLDVGGGANATLEFQTSADVVLSDHDMNATAFGASSSGTATANAIADATAGNSGTAAKFVCKDKAGTEVFRGTVSATSGGGDMELDNTNIASGQNVSVDSLTYTGESQ